MISIIVPVYNAERYLARCVDSVLGQTYPSWELILVDDGSFDRSPTICDEYVGRDGRIKVVHKKNGGLSSARNVGLDMMRGEYVTFLDSDDYWHPCYLEVLLNLVEEKQADIAQCDFVRGDSSVFPTIQLEKAQAKEYSNESIFTLYAAKIIVCAKLYKSKLWDGLRMPEGKINEDDFTTWKLYYRAQKIVVSPLPLYYYYVNTSSIMAKQKKTPRLDFIEAYQERIGFFEKEKNWTLKIMSEIQFCKSLSLYYLSLKRLKEREKAGMVLDLYRKYIKDVLRSDLMPLSLRVYFHLFNMSPLLLSSVLKLKNG